MYYRIFAPPNSPIYFGKAARNRWDDPLSAFGVFYVGEGFDAAAVETLLHSERSRRVLARQLETRNIAFVFPTKQLRLVDMTEARTLRSFQIDDGFCKGPSADCRELFRAIYNSGWDVDGIRYASRLAPRFQAVAIYERSKTSILAVDAGKLSDEKFKAILSQWVKSMGVRIVPG